MPVLLRGERVLWTGAPAQVRATVVARMLVDEHESAAAEPLQGRTRRPSGRRDRAAQLRASGRMSPGAPR